MINSLPEIMVLAVDFQEHLIQVPPPVAGFHSSHTALFDLCCKEWLKPMPPVSHRFMADIDATLMQQIFEIPEREREADL